MGLLEETRESSSENQVSTAASTPIPSPPKVPTPVRQSNDILSQAVAYNSVECSPISLSSQTPITNAAPMIPFETVSSETPQMPANFQEQQITEEQYIGASFCYNSNNNYYVDRCETYQQNYPNNASTFYQCSVTPSEEPFQKEVQCFMQPVLEKSEDKNLTYKS